MSTPQRMSKKRLAKLESRTMKGYDSYELVQALKAAEAVIERVELLPELLGDMANERTRGQVGKRPHEKGVATGFRVAAAHIRAAIHPAPEQSK